MLLLVVFVAFEAPMVKRAAALHAQRPKAAGPPQQAKGKPKGKPKAAEPAKRRRVS